MDQQRTYLVLDPLAREDKRGLPVALGACLAELELNVVQRGQELGIPTPSTSLYPCGGAAGTYSILDEVGRESVIEQAGRLVVHREQEDALGGTRHRRERLGRTSGERGRHLMRGEGKANGNLASFPVSRLGRLDGQRRSTVYRCIADS